MCYVTLSIYDTTTISLIINYSDTSAFCMHVMYNTSYDTPTMGSLIKRPSSIKNIYAQILKSRMTCIQEQKGNIQNQKV
jgi:hypothetical protein